MLSLVFDSHESHLFLIVCELWSMRTCLFLILVSNKNCSLYYSILLYCVYFSVTVVFGCEARTVVCVSSKALNFIYHTIFISLGNKGGAGARYNCHCWMNLPVGPPRLLMAVFTAIATLSLSLHDTVCTSGECHLQLVKTLRSVAVIILCNCLTLHI